MHTYSLAGICVTVAAVVGHSVVLDIPEAPPAGTQALSGSFQGFSMEMASFPDIAGNLKSPNPLSNRMLQNLKDISGSAVPIRIGGTTANHAIWTPDQKEAIIQNFAVPGADQPANATWGPKYLESFKVLPKGTKYTVGLTFDSGERGENTTVAEATAFYESLGQDLYAFEVGNEFDAFPVNRNVSTWSIKEYVGEWLERVARISDRLLSTKNQRLFQSGVFVAPGTITNDSSWTAQTAIDLGIASTGRAKTFCTHQYFGAACRPVKPTLAQNLMNRTALTTAMAYHAGASAYTVGKGIPYVIGETNSIACQGLAGVSDTFGATLWSIDYALYAASLNVSKIYWHMGTGYRYASWQAIRNGTTMPGPRPLYYGNWFTATVLGNKASQVVSVANTTSLAGYAIYTSDRRRSTLRSIVLVNMDLYNSTSSPASQRQTVSFELPAALVQNKPRMSVRRISAAGAEVQDGVSFSGQTIDLNGKITGKEVREKVTNGVVKVKASEAVLISID